MRIATEFRRPLGTMIVYGFARVAIEVDLDIAVRIGAEVVEVLPDWRALPDPALLARLIEDRGLSLHSAHGCWGGQTIRAERVDLGSCDPQIWTESLEDLKCCVEWLGAADGNCLVVHPGGLSDPAEAEQRLEALRRGLVRLADHASGSGVTICVENMPPGVYPGSRMLDLRKLVDSLDHPNLGLVLDTGHAHIAGSTNTETVAAGARLRTTHVHDNNGRQDAHLPPGQGTIDWSGWINSLDAVEYRGPIVLECIKHLREKPASITDEFLDLLQRMCGLQR